MKGTINFPTPALLGCLISCEPGAPPFESIFRVYVWNPSNVRVNTDREPNRISPRPVPRQHAGARSTHFSRVRDEREFKTLPLSMESGKPYPRVADFPDGQWKASARAMEISCANARRSESSKTAHAFAPIVQTAWSGWQACFGPAPNLRQSTRRTA